MREVVIVSAARTPIGSFNGALKALPAAKLGAVAIREAVKRAGIDGADVDEVLMGCVLPAAQGQAPARQAALSAGLPNSVPCTTVNKVCGSGLKTVTMGAQAIVAGDADIVVAGGMENMDLAPYALAIVETAEGVRLTAQIADCELDQLKIGMPVRFEFRRVYEDCEASVIYYGYKAVPKL